MPSAQQLSILLKLLFSYSTEFALSVHGLTHPQYFSVYVLRLFQSMRSLRTMARERAINLRFSRTTEDNSRSKYSITLRTDNHPLALQG
ncbi:hypothetical protein BOTBODRAFT_404758 [Botryobasidium botryosum FD-172 SS1]|uniref:Secreted protein n=1 Tax=Botryobasidium botryosum (strain FD-172 SS1) TaxID=930990 RepID=A0A067MDY8_BOTB1|nr:hypothetical protein BOTBODRAFT_404758 [Botryobasidium botryosum FD-172 SS1]